MKITGYGKKFLSLVLATAMTATLCIPVWAEEGDVSSGLSEVTEDSSTVEAAQATNSQSSAPTNNDQSGDAQDDQKTGTVAQQPVTMSLDQPETRDAGTTVTVTDEASWQKAIQEAQAGVETTIMVGNDLVLSKSVTVNRGQILVVDFQGHTITVTSEFVGRIFTNKGTLTLQGNGSVDVSAAGANGYGTVNNFGTLTVADGTYTNPLESGTNNFYNRSGGTATFETPTIYGGGGCVATETDTTTVIHGGTYSDKTYPAIENRGDMLITAGQFVNTSCSSCDSSKWGYTIRSGMDSADAYLKIQGAAEDSVQVTGVQGGLSVIGGTADIYNGVYKTVPCSVHTNGASAFYAGYFTGESYKTSTNIYGGSFTSCTKTAILVGNGNPAPDSGAGKESTVMIYGGSFTGGDAKKTAISVNEANYAVGAAYIEGGSFSSDPSTYVTDKNCDVELQNGQYVVQKMTAENAVAQIGDTYYSSLGKAIQKVGDGETITLLRDVPEAQGLSVEGGKNFTVDFAGHTYTLNEPGAGSPGTTTNGFQLLQGSKIVFKNGTIRISEKNGTIGKTPIKRIIQNYADLKLEGMQIYAANQVGGENYVLSFNQGNITFSGNTSIYMSKPASAIAFDVCYWKDGGYDDGTYVTFAEGYTGTIQGSIIYDSADPDKATLNIAGGGKFQAIKLSATTTNGATVSVTGGCFVKDPSDYLAQNKTISTCDEDGYNYQVVDKNPDAVEVVPGAPDTANPAAEDATATQDEKELAEAIGNELSDLYVDSDVLNAAANKVANENKITEAEGEEALTNAGITVGGNTVTIVVQPYLDIELLKTSIQEDQKSFRLDITPMYRTIATTADVESNDPIIVDGTGKNAVVMGKARELTVTKTVEMRITLPTGFAKDDTTLYVLHEKDNGSRCQYTGTVSGNVLTFTNPDGFSVFTVSTEKFDLSTNTTTNGGNNTTATPAPTAAPQQSGSNITYYTCPACGYHNWTATAEGYKCDHCGYVESVKQLSGYGNVKGIYEPKTSTAAAQSASGAAVATATSAIPQTSDELPLAGLVVVAIAALLGLGVTVVLKKRSNR